MDNQNKNMKRTGCFFAGLLIVVLLIFLIVKIHDRGYTTKEKTIYVPDINLYIKLVWQPYEKFGYILFGKDSMITVNKNVDYLKVAKNMNTTLIFNSNDNKKIYLPNSTVWQLNESNKLVENKISNIIQINQVEYKIIDGIKTTDSTFFEKKKHYRDYYSLKLPYFSVIIYSQFEGFDIGNVTFGTD